jgi:tRNA(Ile)-lysidine synthase
LPGNVSANARRLRYQALCDVAISENAMFVAVAHQGEDQLETMLAALCRGAGLEGLIGMPWERTLAQCREQAPQPAQEQSAGRGGLRLIRPMLAIRRSDCESLCQAAGVAWREDPTNVDVTRARARLRRDVLPVLEDLWPDAPRRVTATSEILSAATAALNQAIANAFGDVAKAHWDRRLLANVPVAILAAGLRKAALAMAPRAADELNQRHLMQVAELIASDDRRPHVFDWPRGLRVRVTANHVTMASGTPSD